MANKKVARATRWVILGDSYNAIDWGYGIKEAQKAFSGAMAFHGKEHPTLYFEDEVAKGIEADIGKREKPWQF